MTRIPRRQALLLSGTTGIGVVAGCLGDDDDVDDADDIDDTDDDADGIEADDADDADDQVPAADEDDTDDDPTDEPQTPDIHDATLVFTHPDIRHPADQNFHPHGGDAQFPWPFHDSQPKYFSHSWSDLQAHPQLVRDYDYQPGILQFTLYEDFYWWNGQQLTIEDFLAEREFANYYWGGDDLDAHEAMVAWEQIDEFTARISLADTWHERWALEQTIENDYPSSSRPYYTRWIEQFEDAGDLEAIEDVRTELGETIHNTDEEIVDHFFHPFEFRFDGSIGDVGETWYEFEWTPEKNGNLRHFANLDNSDRLANFDTIRADVVEEPEVWESEMFFEEQLLPYHGFDEDLEEIAEFEVRVEQWANPTGEFGCQFNHAVHPSDNVHFRRAWAYFTDNTAWETPTRIPPEHHHPFMQDAELYSFVSEEVIDAFTEYGWNEHRWDDAETELEMGGFERNADGDWLLYEDSPDGDAGEPMEFTIQTYDWMGWIADLATDFWADLEDFGIQTEIIPERAAWGVHEDYVVSMEWTGGGSPEHTFTQVFVEPDFRNAYNVPSTIQAPEFLETTGPGDSTDDWREYDTEAMAQRLGVTTEETAYQSLVDQLTWCANQTIPHFTPSSGMSVSFYNDYTWDFIDPDEYPEMATEANFRNLWRGAFQYVPEDER